MSDDSFNLAYFIQEGGWGMYAILCIGGLAHLLGVAALGSMAASRRAMPLGMGAATLLFAVTTMCAGVAGYVTGMQNVEEAIMYVDPESQAMMREQGQSEADNNLYFGGCAILFPLLAGVAAIGRGAMMRDKPGAS